MEVLVSVGCIAAALVLNGAPVEREIGAKRVTSVATRTDSPNSRSWRTISSTGTIVLDLRRGDCRIFEK